MILKSRGFFVPTLKSIRGSTLKVNSIDFRPQHKNRPMFYPYIQTKWLSTSTQNQVIWRFHEMMTFYSVEGLLHPSAPAIKVFTWGFRSSHSFRPPEDRDDLDSNDLLHSEALCSKTVGVGIESVVYQDRQPSTGLRNCVPRSTPSTSCEFAYNIWHFDLEYYEAWQPSTTLRIGVRVRVSVRKKLGKSYCYD